MSLLLHFTKLEADLKVIKNSGTSVANSEHSLGLDCIIKSFGVDSGGPFCTFDSYGVQK